MKECFGRYVFEDIECMQCNECGACRSEQKRKNDEYKLSLISKECRKCPKALECRIHLTKSCLGLRGKKKGVQKCSCSCKNYCITLSTEPKQYRCKKSVECFSHDIRFFNLFSEKFEKGKIYNFYISCKEVYFDNNSNELQLLFRDKDYIFNEYFEEIKK